MGEITVTKIPLPTKILKGEWYGIVYAIETTSTSESEHSALVAECIREIMDDYDETLHYSVSLREVKRELVHADASFSWFCTLVEFRLRDSY